MADRVRVMTFNLLALGQADGAKRHAVIKRGIAALRPDIIALQEVTRSSELDQAAALAGHDFALAGHPGASRDGVGACLASRWPLGQVHALQPQVPPSEGTLSWAGTVAAEVLAPAPFGPLLVVHHKPSWQLDREYEREQQAVAAARFIEDLAANRPDLPVVLAGDLDAAPDTASIRFWTGRQSLAGVSVRYEDAWARLHPGEDGHTFTPRNPLVRTGEMPMEQGRRIDYIMIRCSSHGPMLDVARCRVVFDQPADGVWASDHFGLLADLQRPPALRTLWAP